MRCYNRTVKSSCPLLESLEARMLFAAILPQVTVTARAAAAYEGGPATRFFYIRRSGETSAGGRLMDDLSGRLLTVLLYSKPVFAGVETA